MTDAAPQVRGGFPKLKPTEAPAELGPFVAALRRLQDLAVSTNPDGELCTALTERIHAICALRESQPAPQGVASAGRIIDLPGLGHPRMPPWTITESGPGTIGGARPDHPGRWQKSVRGHQP